MPFNVTDRQIEDLAQKLGREMFDRMQGGRPAPWRLEWLEERMMQLCMRDEWFKVQAFRFIDALPMIGDARDVARHLREYFVRLDRAAARENGHATHANGHAAASHAPQSQEAVRDRRTRLQTELAELAPSKRSSGLLDFISRQMNFRSLNSPKARLFAWLARFSSTKMAHRFIAGTNVREAEAAIRKMRKQSLAFTIDVLGEAAVSEPESVEYQQIYLDLITQLPQYARGWETIPQIDLADGVPVPRINVSVKLSSLYSQFDAIDPIGTKKWAKERLRPLLRQAMKDGTHIHIDMEHYAFKDLTLELCREIFMEDEFRDYPHFGIVLQAYLKECERDTADMIDWTKKRGVPIWIRLVKGAYWDTETVLAKQKHWPCPVWEQKWQSDACYERVSRLLLQNHKHIHTAFGSHNVRSLAHAMALKRLWEIPGTAFELQMLYGMGDPIKRAAVEMGERCRVYTPYGELLPGMAYLIRRLLENTANESFLRHSVSEETPVEELLRNPEEIGRATPPHEEPPVLRFEYEEALMHAFANVPDTDFTKEDNRQKMLAALQEWRGRSTREYPLIIGGERIASGEWHEAHSPSRPGDKLGRYAMATKELAEKAVTAASDALRDWRWVPPAERAEYLFKVAQIMERRRFDLAALMSLECGKPWREADGDLSESIDFCNFYGQEMIRMAENIRRRDIPGETNEYYYAPRGIVGVIAPWNFPLAILTGMTTAALVTGNAVIVKPAETASVIAAQLVEMFEEAGLPKGVLNYLPGRGSVVGEVLVHHPKVAMIAFTGSREVGCRINQVAAATFTSQPALKKVIAEMGGKNGLIIDSDADLDEAVKGALYSAFGYAGQKCSACSRLIVLDAVYEKVLPRLVEAARSLQVGPADDYGTYVPPVIDKKAWETIRKYIEIGKGESKLALEVDVNELIQKTGGGYYIGPTIFRDVAPDARVAKEEIFGPVLAVVRARDLDDAIRIFNSTDFALTGGIYSRSPANLERARRECECGNFYINRKITGALVDLQPFGGFKMSGIGSKAGGPDYLIQFCEPRCVTENTLRRGFAPSEEVVGALGA